MMLRIAVALIIGMLAMLPAPAMAAERGYTVTEFDRIRVDGAFDVTVETGTGTYVRASGSAQAIERLNVFVQGRTLVIRALAAGWGGYPGANIGTASVKVRVPVLIAAALNGAGALRVAAMRSARVSVSLAGAGVLTVANAQTDRLTATQSGSGQLTIAGSALLGAVSNEGSGTFDGAALSIGDLKLNALGSGQTTIGARRSANIAASGSGDVRIVGTPACTVNAAGSGTVACGKTKATLR